jgi:hypothetical protein
MTAKKTNILMGLMLLQAFSLYSSAVPRSRRSQEKSKNLQPAFITRKADNAANSNLKGKKLKIQPRSAIAAQIAKGITN